MPSEIAKPYIGPLSRAPQPFKNKVEKLPVFPSLLHSSWTESLFWSRDDDLGVLFKPFQWEEDSAWIWLCSTLGLSGLTQKRATRGEERASFDRFEIVFSFSEPNPGDRSWTMLRESYGKNSLSEVSFMPRLFESFLECSRTIKETIGRVRLCFGDTLDCSPINSILTCSLITPPIPEMFYEGIRPLSDVQNFDLHDMENWLDADFLTINSSVGYYQIAPISPTERDYARKRGGEAFLLEYLIPSDELIESDKVDSSEHIVNIHRSSFI